MAEKHRDHCLVLDVRDEEKFRTGHLPDSGNVPLMELTDRRSELPIRDSPLLVVGADDGQAGSAAAALEGMGFTTVSWLAAPIETLRDGLSDRAAAAPLWRPSPFLAEVLPLLPRGRAIDLASGSGRDAVFLAQHGYEVEAWDIDPEALGWGSGLATRNGVTITTVHCDLERPDPPLAAEHYDLIVCMRFLCRPIFPHLSRALALGGMLVYETYRLGQEQFGKPRRPQFLLDPGELRRAFEGLEVLRYEEPSPPGGPWTSRLLARKPKLTGA